jgi:hypothetical protein
VGKEHQGHKEDHDQPLHESSRNKGSGQLMDEPFIRAFAVDFSTLRLVVLAAAKFDLWAPLSTAFLLAFLSPIETP